MKRIAVLAVALSLGGSAAFAGPPTNTASSGDATPAVVQTVMLANGTLLTVEPTH
jgi:hypothetical protein